MYSPTLSFTEIEVLIFHRGCQYNLFFKAEYHSRTSYKQSSQELDFMRR